MKSWFVACLGALAALVAPPVAADVIIDNDLEVIVQVAVTNVSSQTARFVLTAANCRTVAPLEIAVPAGGTTNVSITWDYHDRDGDSCYTDHHYTEYMNVSDINSRFRIQQSNSDSRLFCLDIKYYLVFWINQAVCPDVSGNVVTAQNGADDQGVSCPANVPNCPPYDDGESTLYFGVLYGAGSAAAAPGQPIPALSLPAMAVLGAAILLVAFRYARRRPPG